MKRSTALVIGGGFSGLLAATVLADYFEKVTIIDKDPALGAARPRPGAMQGAHLHVLLKRGQEILFKLFPQIEDELKKSGCPLIDWSNDTEWENGDGTFPRYESNVKTLSTSRPLLESLIYSKVKMKPNINFKTTLAERITFLNEQKVIVATRSGDSITADLLVLAAGHHFPLQKHFPSVAIEAKTVTLPINISYRSQIFKTDSLNFRGSKQYYYQLAPPKDSFGGVISPIENNLSIATIVQYGSNELNKIGNLDFLQKAANIPKGTFSTIIRDGMPVSPVSILHKSTMHLRAFHKMRGIPGNIIFIGDLFCSLNPVFGQGMTLALEQAMILKDLLKINFFNAHRFHKLSFKKAKFPFLLSKIGSGIKSTYANGYMQRFILRCQSSPKIHLRFLNVLHLKASYFSLFDFRSLIPLGDPND